MPRITVTEKDMLRSKIVEPAWYLVIIDSVGEASSKAGDSTNYPVEATIIKNADTGSLDFAGVPVSWMFNSKAISFAFGFLAAFGVDVKAGSRYDLDSATGKQVEVFIETDTYNGRLVNRPQHKYRTPSQV